MTKTPNFNKALEVILKDLKPYDKNCRQCGNSFHIFQEDIDFYHRLQVPSPSLCPLCRKRRRLSFFLRTLRFYKIQCQVSNHNEKVVSQHPSDSSLIIYDYDYWLSDQWDPLDYGKNYEEDKDFLSQFRELITQAPSPTIERPFNSVNCEYAIGGLDSKDCYYTSAPLKAERIYYSFTAGKVKDCVDITETTYSELCYESIDAEHCYNCSFIQDCANCIDSAFLFDCRNCQNCFGCTNLRNKQYCWFNKQLSKEEYLKRRNEIFLGDRNVLNQIKEKFKPLYKSALRRTVDNQNAVNSIGNKIRGCKNCFNVIWTMGDSENVRYSDYLDALKDSMDVWGASNNSLLYEAQSIAGSEHIKMSRSIKSSSNLEYCLNVSDCHNCFGCVSLRNKNYCILNRQYSEKEYWRLLDKIKTKMLENKMYGEFFSTKWKLHPYNDSIAQWEFPLTQQKAEELDYWWKEEESSEEQSLLALKANEVPIDIRTVEGDILEKAIICEETGKSFQIIKPELEFYRKQGLPLPTIHPRQRIYKRYKKRTAFQLWDYNCPKCGQKTYTAYSPEQQKEFKIWCEQCYLKETT